MADVPALQAECVGFSYGDAPVLEDVCLRVEPGEFVSIVGPNGGGKTTLLRLFLGLEQPDQGWLRVLGQPPRRARPRVGYMPQRSSHDLQFPVTVQDVVLMGRLDRCLAGPFRAADRKAAARALEEVNLAEMAGRAFEQLSGGQRQRVLIARALATEPEVLLLDEPTANVDAAVEERLFEILRKLNERMTVAVVSHDLGFVSQYVERVVCVNRRVVVHPTSELSGEMIQDIYGGDLHMVRHDHRCHHPGPHPPPEHRHE